MLSVDKETAYPQVDAMVVPSCAVSRFRSILPTAKTHSCPGGPSKNPTSESEQHRRRVLHPSRYTKLQCVVMPQLLRLVDSAFVGKKLSSRVLACSHDLFAWSVATYVRLLNFSFFLFFLSFAFPPVRFSELADHAGWADRNGHHVGRGAVCFR